MIIDAIETLTMQTRGRTKIDVVASLPSDQKRRLSKLKGIYDAFPLIFKDLVALGAITNASDRDKKERWENVFAFCCRWSLHPKSVDSARIWDSFFSLYAKDRRLRRDDWSHDERPEAFVSALKERCESFERTEEIDSIASEYRDRYSYASNKNQSIHRKTAYRYGTAVLDRYGSFGEFKDAVVSEGRPKAEAELILDAFATRIGCNDASSRSSLFYYLKIDENATAVTMTIEFVFSGKEYALEDVRVERDVTSRKDVRSRTFDRSRYLRNDKFLVLRGTNAKTGAECTFAMIDKALWMCVHSSWLIHMDTELPCYGLLKKHWFFRSYDPVLDRIRKQNVLFSLLNWIDPGCPWAKKCTLMHDDVMFNDYYDALFVIINRFKDRIGRYDALEEHVKNSFLDANNANVPSLVKSVRDMITLRREHVLNVTTARRVLALFERNVVPKSKHPIAYAVLEEMIKRRQYVGSIEGASGKESVRVTTRNKFIGYDFVPEFGCTKQKFFESAENDMRKYDEMNAFKDARCDDNDERIVVDDYTSIEDESIENESIENETIDDEDENRNFNDTLKKNMMTKKRTLKKSSSASSYSFDTMTDDTMTDESMEDDDEGEDDESYKVKDKKRTTRRIVELNKKIATLALYILCASPDLPNEYATSLFLNLNTITVTSSRKSDKNCSTLIPKSRKQIIERQRRLEKLSEEEIKKLYVVNNRKSKRSMIYEPDKFEITPLRFKEGVIKQQRSNDDANVVKTPDDDVDNETKDDDASKSTKEDKRRRIRLDPSRVINNFLWTDPVLSIAYDRQYEVPFVVCHEEFKDVVTTTDVFLCMCENLSSSYFEKDERKRRRYVTSSTYARACNETLLSSPKSHHVDNVEEEEEETSREVDFSSSIVVVEPEKRSKFANKRKLARKGEAPAFDFVIVNEEPHRCERYDDSDEEHKSSAYLGRQYVSEESFVMIFRNKQPQQRPKNDTYDFICDTLFFETAHERYASRCLFDYASDLQSFDDDVRIVDRRRATEHVRSNRPSLVIKEYNGPNQRKKRSIDASTPRGGKRNYNNAFGGVAASNNVPALCNVRFVNLGASKTITTTQNKRTKLK